MPKGNKGGGSGGSGGTTDGIVSISGGRKNDILTGGPEDNYITGKDGDDTLYGNGGNDRLVGGNGNDTLWGGDDDDRLHGGSGDDFLFGEAGDDELQGGLGSDVMDGGAGTDTASFQELPPTTSGGTDGVEVVATGDNAFTATRANGEVDTLLNIECLVGTNVDDHFDLTEDTNGGVVIGARGNDTFILGSGPETLVFYGSYGNGDGTDTIIGFGEGDLIVLVGVSGDVSVETVDGDTVITYAAYHYEDASLVQSSITVEAVDLDGAVQDGADWYFT